MKSRNATQRNTTQRFTTKHNGFLWSRTQLNFVNNSCLLWFCLTIKERPELWALDAGGKRQGYVGVPAVCVNQGP